MQAAARRKAREDPSVVVVVVVAGADSIAAKLQSNCRSLRQASSNRSPRLSLCRSRLPGRRQARILKMKRRRSLHHNLSGVAAMRIGSKQFARLRFPFQHDERLIRARNHGLGNRDQLPLLIEHTQSRGFPLT
jgi:hypothetical protein